MNTPTPITEAHRNLAFELMQMDERLSAFAHRTAAQLIADSEARAVATLTAERDLLLAELHILEKLNKETVQGAGLLAESHYTTIKDLRAEVERCNDIINRASTQFFHDGTDRETAAKMLKFLNEAKPCELCGGLALGQENCDAAYDELRVDCDELRADVVRLTARAEHAEAELATERARLDWLESRTSTLLFRYSVGGWSISDDAENAKNLLDEYTLYELRAAIDAAMKEDAQ